MSLASEPDEQTAVPPIVVLSFNRPHYLRAVLESLKAQRPPIDPARVHLFQDGADNAYSGTRRAEPTDIVKSCAVFFELFPGGRLHFTGRNVGIAENFRRAEEFVFNELKAPVGYFFEDDLVLSPHYVAALDTLRRAFAAYPEIGYFNACGRYLAPLAEQVADRRQVMEMGHTWGFALKRRHWLDLQPFLEQYYSLVAGKDYRQRPHVEVRALFASWAGHEMANPATSQDAAKDFATQILGRWRASSVPALARYIGAEGTHFNPGTFQRLGFDRSIMFDGELPEPIIDRDIIARGIAQRQVTLAAAPKDPAAITAG